MKRRVHNLGPPEQQQANKTTVVVKSSGKNVSHVRITEAPKLDSRHAWARLHLQEIGDVNWLYRWSTLIPGTCSCRNDASEILKKLPPVYDSPESWFEWTINFHNAVNAKLGKPTVSLDRAYMLWRHRRPATSRTRAIVTVANGTQFVEMLRLTRPFMQAYADRVNADLIDLDNDTESWGPMEKFRVWHFAQQYDEVLFVDADCLIKPNAPNIFEKCTETICIYDEYGDYKSDDFLRRERKAVGGLSGREIRDTCESFNSGVILSRRSAADIWKRPEVEIGTTHCAEQIWISEQIGDAVKQGASIGKLDPRWNWQWWRSTHDEGSFEAGLKHAWIVHFASAPNRLKLIGDYIATL